MTATLTAAPRKRNKRGVTADFTQFEKLIHAVCHCYQRKHGGDYEELFAEASAAFLAARERYDGERAKLGTWVYTQVYYALVDRRCKEASRATRERAFSNLEDAGDTFGGRESLAAADDAPEQLPDRHHFSLRRFLAEVSDDAAVVARLALEAVVGEPKDRLPVLRAVFAELGWAARRFRRAVVELREALYL